MAIETLATYKKDMIARLGRERADDEPRPVVETLLRVGIHSVAKAFRAGRTAIVWYDQQGTWVGCGNITRYDSNYLVMECITNKIHRVKSSKFHFECKLMQVEHGGFFRASFKCPVCFNAIDKILCWEGVWACSSCHDAIHLSTRLSGLQRNYAAYLGLMSSVGERPAKGERRAAFEQDYERLRTLDRYWSSRPKVVLPPIWYQQIHERFYIPDDAPEIGERERRR